MSWGIVLGVAGLAMNAVGAISQGMAASKAADYNAAINARNAQIAQQQAQADAEAQQRQAYQRMGAIRAAYGASGVTPEGSPLDILANSASQAELDRQNILYKGKLRAIGYTDQSNLDAMQSDAAMTSGYIGAGSSLLTGGANIIRMYPPVGSGKTYSGGG
jgi:parvulin-like peptidyl-prolyl isomerase